MKAQYRTSDGTWGVMEYPLIGIEQDGPQFILTGYVDPHDAHMESPRAGIADVLQFEIFEGEDEA